MASTAPPSMPTSQLRLPSPCSKPLPSPPLPVSFSPNKPSLPFRPSLTTTMLIPPSTPILTPSSTPMTPPTETSSSTPTLPSSPPTTLLPARSLVSPTVPTALESTPSSIPSMLATRTVVSWLVTSLVPSRLPAEPPLLPSSLLLLSPSPPPLPQEGFFPLVSLT